jgi:hypothetical protein
MCDRKVTLSIKAATMISFSNRSVQLENSRVVVKIILDLSERSDIT